MIDLNVINWEILPENVFKVMSYEGISKKYDRISFTRDNNYNLQFKLEGKIKNDGVFQLSEAEKMRPGQLIKADAEKNIAEGYGMKVEYGRIHVQRENIGIDEISVEGSVQRIQLNYDSKGEIAHVKHWYVNGISDGALFYTRFTETKTSAEAEIGVREFCNDKIKLHESYSSCRDSICFEINNKKFIFGHIEINESHKNNRSFLRFEKKDLPDEKELTAIEQSLSYIFGITLIHVGYTAYSVEWFPVEKVFYSPNIRSIDSICKVSPQPIIPIGVSARKGLEQNISKLINCYYTSREHNQSIRDVLWYIGLYFQSPSLDTELQPLATAYDLFLQIWFQSNSRSKGKYMADDEYKKVIAKYLQGISDDLTCEAKDKILKKVSRCNEMSDNERNSTVFIEMGLEIGEVEMKAIRERNTAVHGTLQDRDYQKVFDMTRAFYSLLNRMLLKYFDYSGDYVDYATYGFPVRNINVRLGGNE